MRITSSSLKTCAATRSSNGEHYVQTSPNTIHQTVMGNLIVAIAGFSRGRNLGQLFKTPCAVVLSNIDVVQPDLMFISKARESIITEKNVQGAPDLVIEILSDSTRRVDEIEKRKLYEGRGVSEYWIVDPVLESVKIYRRAAANYERIAEISTESGGTLETPLIAGLKIDIADVFRTA